MNRRGFLKRLLHGAALGAAAAFAPSIAKDDGDEKLKRLQRRQAEMRRARDQFERMNEEFARTFFYGSDAAAARDFTGFAARYGKSPSEEVFEALGVLEAKR